MEAHLPRLPQSGADLSLALDPSRASLASASKCEHHAEHPCLATKIGQHPAVLNLQLVAIARK